MNDSCSHLHSVCVGLLQATIALCGRSFIVVETNMTLHINAPQMHLVTFFFSFLFFLPLPITTFHSSVTLPSLTWRPCRPLWWLCSPRAAPISRASEKVTFRWKQEIAETRITGIGRRRSDWLTGSYLVLRPHVIEQWRANAVAGVSYRTFLCGSA